METKISATDLAKRLSDVLNRVRYRGERFLIERNGEPVATVLPLAGTRGMTIAELFEGLRTMNWPDDGFGDDLEAIQATQPKVEFPEWAS